MKQTHTWAGYCRNSTGFYVDRGQKVRSGRASEDYFTLGTGAMGPM
jgi:hypothetical protein